MESSKLYLLVSLLVLLIKNNTDGYIDIGTGLAE